MKINEMNLRNMLSTVQHVDGDLQFHFPTIDAALRQPIVDAIRNALDVLDIHEKLLHALIDDDFNNELESQQIRAWAHVLQQPQRRKVVENVAKGLLEVAETLTRRFKSNRHD